MLSSAQCIAAEVCWCLSICIYEFILFCYTSGNWSEILLAYCALNSVHHSHQSVSLLSKMCMGLTLQMSYSWMPDRSGGWNKPRGGVENSSKLNKRGVGINRTLGNFENLENLENWKFWKFWKLKSWKFKSQVGIEKILFNTLKSNTKKLKCFGLLSFIENKKFLNQMHSFRHYY